MVLAKSNIVLIGMAGSGKSSIGRMLAERIARPFVDTDDLIIAIQGRPLQDIIDAEGPLGFRKIEERILLDVNVRNHVIATGGSSIYSSAVMEHLGRDGVIILLHVEPALLLNRVGDTSGRGLVRQPFQTFEELYAEREPLYNRHADMVVECGRLDPKGVCAIIEDRLATEGFLSLR